VNWRRTQAWCDAMETRSAGCGSRRRAAAARARAAPGPSTSRAGGHPPGPHRAGPTAAAPCSRSSRGARHLPWSGHRARARPAPLREPEPRAALQRHPPRAAGARAVRHLRRVRIHRRPRAAGHLRGGRARHRAARPPGARPIEAIAPTILCLLGLPVPDGMDAPRCSIPDSQARAATPLTYVPDVAPTAAAGDEGYASEEDVKQVEAGCARSGTSSERLPGADRSLLPALRRCGRRPGGRPPPERWDGRARATRSPS